MMAALLSAMVSSMTSFFNSSSTVFTMDLWRRLRPRVSEREMMVVGRLWILCLVGVSILWLPMLQLVKGSQFWDYSRSISSFLMPPVVMTFLFGIFWSRATEQVDLFPQPLEVSNKFEQL
jgi:Na+/proline symporter